MIKLHESYVAELGFKFATPGSAVIRSIDSAMELQAMVDAYRVDYHYFVHIFLSISDAIRTSDSRLTGPHDKPIKWHSPSLIRIFAICMKKAWVLKDTILIASHPNDSKQIKIRISW